MTLCVVAGCGHFQAARIKKISRSAHHQLYSGRRAYTVMQSISLVVGSCASSARPDRANPHIHFRLRFEANSASSDEKLSVGNQVTGNLDVAKLRDAKTRSAFKEELHGRVGGHVIIHLLIDDPGGSVFTPGTGLPVSQAVHPGYNIGLPFCGFYCLLIGCLILRSTFLPRILGVLLTLAGVGWLSFLSPPVTQALSRDSALPGVIGELWLTLWLIVKGVNERR